MSSETKKTDRSPQADRTRVSRIVAWVLGLGAAVVPVVAIIGVVAFLLTYMAVDVPAPGDLKQNQVATITDSKGNVLARVVPPEGNRIDVKYSQIPESMIEAVKAAEDRDFDSNSGFSIRGFSRAALGKLTGNAGAGGGSTITQQYVKNAMVGDQASGLAGYKRKFKELAISTKMSSQWSKEDIMTAYLNTIYFGRGAYGVAAAAKAYFGKEVSKLTVSESALLAAVIRGPSIYDPAVDEQLARQRWDYVLEGMVKIDAISQAEKNAQAFPKTITPKPIGEDEESKGPNGLIKRQVLAELDKLGISEQEVRTGGLKITTAIDPKVQEALEDASKSKMTGEPKDLRTASVSVDPSTGGISGYFGGWDGAGWDYASTGLQTGSVFKTFALIAALEQDIPLSKQYSSDPYRTSSGLLVENSDGESCGTCNLATAMKMSLNTVYYRLMMDLKNGADDVVDAAHKAGISETINGEKSLRNANGRTEGGVVLGQYDSTVLDMASSYATLAASGIYREPFFVKKVETSDGQTLFDRQPNPGKRVFAAKVADNVTAALEPIAAYSGGNSLYDSSYGARPSAAKTGTAQLGTSGQNRYSWMVGYTPQLSTAVWVGTARGDKPLVNYGGAAIYGSGLPSQIWKAAMDQALAGETIESFPTPAAVGGQAGVPYEPPPYTPPPSSSWARPSRPTLPSIDVTIPPEWNIPGLPTRQRPNRPGRTPSEQGETVPETPSEPETGEVPAA
ncbi:putative penicillin-binding protein [Gordonia hirsuta DSM 44140 = NBRC 16056]|uniref:Putative penicillin-binding protein n=1 Tax=Gordonia hirsuta DSM 44140 = NBRC 16056 TaxID=1121927 RepID=L7LDH1_9ACTN|nr:transglycosylase domain-containing protein [Gordonia hirsuta]GAC58806.1 putative penicillin-binding protein [Gordonia hirsuta DSM 44140 = NBRC 16056]